MTETAAKTGAVLIVGCGYAGREIARLYLAHGWTVTGTTASREHMDALAALGVQPLWMDLGAFLTDPAQQKSLQTQMQDVRVVIYAAGPNRASGERFDDHTVAFAQWLQGAPRPDAFVYLSSTGVYGDVEGAWVDEDTPLTGDAGPRGMLRREVEYGLLSAFSAWGLPLRIVRAAGIYGPGRHVGLRLLTGNYRVIEADPPFVVNRIHVEDLAQGVYMAAKKGVNGEIYLAADGHPAPIREVADYAAALMGRPAPPGEPVAAARRRMGAADFHLVADRKRCKNDKILKQLGVTLAFPDYQSGLEQAIAADGLLESGK